MYGETMKWIRKQKGFTQKEVYTNVVSKTFYSDFEAGKYAVSVDKFTGLLRNLNVSYEEFIYFHNQLSVSDSVELEKRIDDLYKKGQFKELHAIYETHFTSPIKTLRYLAAKAYLLVLITHANFYKFSREPFGEIIAELENAKMWTLNEIRLAKLVLLSIPEKEQAKANQMFARIKQELSKYEQFDSKVYYEETGDLFFNRVQSLLILNHVEGAAATVREYATLMQNADNITLWLQLQFIEILIGLYFDYPAYEPRAKSFLAQTKAIPVAECHFYAVIFDIHKEKAKNFFERYAP